LKRKDQVPGHWLGKAGLIVLGVKQTHRFAEPAFRRVGEIEGKRGGTGDSGDQRQEGEEPDNAENLVR
jgi:hypothetical protein